MAEPQDDRPDVDDDTFIENVREAITNGCEMACVWCGIGLSGDGMDMHDRGCRYEEAARAAAPSVNVMPENEGPFDAPGWASPEPTPGLREATDGLDGTISEVLRKYGGSMKGRGDHYLFDTLVRYRTALKEARAALAASPAPGPPRCEHGAIREPCIPCSEPTPEPTRPRHVREQHAARAAAPGPTCTCMPFFAGHVTQHPDCPLGRQEAAHPAAATVRAAAPLVEPDELREIEKAARDYVEAERRWLEAGLTSDGGKVADEAMARLRAALHEAPDRAAGLREALDKIDPKGSF